ncbi:type II toxin-antitoxin system VapC family toxin [Cryobacterium glaciale]|uniref:Type II toxin-antitoxin system VapC family toxin n=1 Tax=Cryobacterium glaciale TaxID=1259145 RepID=A0A4R8UTV3_9MICO|nr:PIN domain-containing protein [Cryobacterium glaciale]TFB71904.1 type II toxin-antitoxin system VapC family toxin [Cryobacterium glaciale]
MGIPVILLDTSVLIGMSFPSGESLGASVISLAELQFGVYGARTAEIRAQRVRRLSELRELGFEWIPLDEDAARCYGELAAEVSKRRPGHSRSKDIMIAGHAYSLGVALATHNVKDFELIAHLVQIVEL